MSSLSTCVAQLLLEPRADVNAQSIYGFSLLRAAALYGKVKLVRVLLEHGATMTVLPRSRLRRMWNTKKLCSCCQNMVPGRSPRVVTSDLNSRL